MRRGFTLVELLVVISIIAVVFAIVTPVFQYAKESARITSAVSYMHQIGKAIAIYQADWQSSGSYATPSEVGLPTSEYIHKTDLGLTPRPLASPCGYRPIVGLEKTWTSPHYMWALYGDSDHPYWMKRLRNYRENTLVVFDPWCNPAGTHWLNLYEEKRAIGLMVGGQVVNRKKAGEPDLQGYWGPPP
jgi:prepilin-type N-terminal cleavage/methylation domain-containing protein